MTTLFISDLHLSRERPEILNLFLEFLQQEAQQAEALYILGDLFEVWIGDDAATPDILPVIEALKKLTQSGVPLYIMVGNRDFLMGEEFAKFTGCTLIPDPYLIDLYGTTTLLMHGDTLCTDDGDYQKFRSLVRSSDWQSSFLGKSIQERISYAQQAREASKMLTQEKPEEIMDANEQAVTNALLKSKTNLLIHGHTHRPAVHSLEIDGEPAKRIVLGDWYAQESVLRVDKTGFQLTGLGFHNWH